MESRHVEAVLLWSEAGPSDAVRTWLEGRGLLVMTMRAGLLVSGPAASFESAFGVDLQAPPAALPVPRDLRPHVASIAIPRLRRPTE